MDRISEIVFSDSPASKSKRARSVAVKAILKSERFVLAYLCEDNGIRIVDHGIGYENIIRLLESMYVINRRANENKD